ncbi:CoA-disulfide reductase [Brevibacillus ginsengisoli]|uniref:CoA-disulfide reductase n=1 Tax=Brevibacillus ginsengisoli TaxID=363854 RepID=UPI003CF875A5
MSRKIIIVGGVAGGASAAARLRRLNEQDEIIMVERNEHISFANCGLPYYIGGVITDRNKLLVQTVEGMSNRFQLDIRNLCEVVKINRDRKTVNIKDLRTGNEYEESYDVLVLSPGARPIRPAIPGIEEAEHLFTLRNIPDTDAIKSYIDEHKPHHAVVVGGGFIGVEMAENLREQGMDVTLVEMSNQVMAPIDYEMASIVHEHMRAKGIELVLEDGVQAFKNSGRQIQLNSGRELTTDMILLAIGVQPENQLAKDAELELGVRGAIRVSPTMQTSDPAIYAIGDAVEVTDYINGQQTMVPLAWGANRQGRLVADHINGLDATYRGVLGTSIAKVFEMTVAATGNNEKTLKRLGLPYQAVHIHPGSHAGYYPGAAPISLKLLFDPTNGKILGAQAVGADGADKRIDVIATAIKGGLTVVDLPDLELSYAPPYSSAKDPVNMAGYVASNILEGMVETVQWHEIDDIIASGGLLVDVREPIELEAGFIPGAINIPLGQIRDRMNELPKDQTIYVSCQVGLRGYLAARILSQYGFNVKNLDGGYKTYAAVARSKQSESSSQGPASNSSAPTENATQTAPVSEDQISVEINACGLQCPGPIMQVFRAMESMQDGQILQVKATDPGFASDLKAWCVKTGNHFIQSDYQDKVCTALIQKKKLQAPANQLNQPMHPLQANLVPQPPNTEKDGATLVVFSGELDKAIASFIIATGSAAMGKKVTMFFTFWGLNILRKADAPTVEKQPMEKMLGAMMPKGPSQLPLSKMNMGGLGTKMMKNVMEQKNVDSLECLMKTAQEAGVKFVACTMSMDVMGIKKEELIDGIDYAGVATYLGDAENSGLNLFI